MVIKLCKNQNSHMTMNETENGMAVADFAKDKTKKVPCLQLRMTSDLSPGTSLDFSKYNITKATEYIITVRNEVAKVMFLHLSVCPQGGLPQCRDTTPGSSPRPRADTPPSPLGSRHPPDGCCCGRCASYWNAFSCFYTFLNICASYTGPNNP